MAKIAFRFFNQTKDLLEIHCKYSRFTTRARQFVSNLPAGRQVGYKLVTLLVYRCHRFESIIANLQK